MSRPLRDPRARLVLALVILVLAIALSLHFVAMGAHGMAMMVGFCVVILAATAVPVSAGRPVLALASAVPLRVPGCPRHARVEPIGRHPPDEGIRLRL